MYYDNPKLPFKATLIIESPYYAIEGKPCLKHDLSKMPRPEAPDWGGYMSITPSGTASGVTLSSVQTYPITFMPRDGVIPYYEQELHHQANKMEQITLPIEKKR